MPESEREPGAPGPHESAGALFDEPAPTPATGEESGGGSRLTWPLLVLAAVVVANFPAIVGIIDVNPLYTYAGLTRSRATPWLPGVSTIDINVGGTSQALGHRAALDWLHGHVGWWNPYEGLGTPLAAGMQSAVFFPLTLLLAFSDGQLAFRLVLEATAGLTTYLLAERLGLRRSVAGVAGIAFALDGTFAWFQHAAINPVALLPAALLGVEVAYDRELGDWRGLLLPLALALSITAGFPETAFYDDLLVVAWALWRAASAPTGAERLRRTARLGVLGAGGVALTAPLVLAFRSYLSEGNVGAHTSMATVHLPPSDLLTLIDPYLIGPLKAFVVSGSGAVDNLFRTDSGYLLVTGTVLALAGLVLSRRETGIRLLLAAYAGVVTARNFGVTPVERLFAHLPYIKESAVFRSAVPAVELCVVLLAAFGLEAVAGRDDRRWSRARAWHLATASLVVGALLAGLAAGPAHELIHLVWTGTFAADPRPYLVGAAIGTAVLLAGVALGGLAKGRLAVAVVGGLVVAEALCSFGYPELSATRSPVLDLGPVTYLRAHLGSSRFYSLSSNPAVGPVYGGPIAPDYGSYFGLAELDYFDIPDPELFVNEVHDHLDPGAGSEFFGTLFGRHPGAPDGLVELGEHVRAFESLGVRYILTGAAVDLRRYVPDSTRVYDDGFASIYRLPWAARYYQVLSGDCRLSPDGFDEVVATCRRPAVIEREELALAGWSATVNGAAAPLRPADHSLFSAVAVGRGRSVIVWTYRPGHLRLGEALSFIGLLVLAIPVAARAARRRRARHRRGRTKAPVAA